MRLNYQWASKQVSRFSIGSGRHLLAEYRIVDLNVISLHLGSALDFHIMHNALSLEIKPRDRFRCIF